MPDDVISPEKHQFQNDAFIRVINDAVDFFVETPTYQMPPQTRFTGPGVYGIYYSGQFPLYQGYSEQKPNGGRRPIYVGKAVPPGWRQGRSTNEDAKPKFELFARLKEHSRNISVAENLDIADFQTKFVLLSGLEASMIGTLEARLISKFTPLWNSALDGFGNHTPGVGRFDQAKSDWDVIHPGRAWAERCKGKPNEQTVIEARVRKHIESVVE